MTAETATTRKTGSGRSTGRVTIYDVAAHVGVSPSTASRALHNPGRVSEKTVAKVRAAAHELGFMANPAARALPTGRTRTIALLVADIQNPFVFGIISGAQKAADRDGYVLVTSEFAEDSAREVSRLDSLSPAVDGFVLAMSRLNDEELASAGKRRPVVTINRGTTAAPAVLADYEPGLSELLAHLDDLGHRHVAYLSGPANSWTNTKRLEVLKNLTEARAMNLTVTASFSPTREGGASAAPAIKESGASAVVAYNDVMAIGLMQALQAEGVSIPGDISLCGIDNIPGSDYTTPALSTVEAPLADMGELAVRHLLSVILGAGVTTLEPYSTRFVARASTGPAPQTPLR